MNLSWVTLARGDDHGYAVVSRELHLAVERAGATNLEPWTFGADLTVVFALPSTYFFDGGRPRRDLVWHTMIEVEPMPSAWVPVLNLCGAVWAPSNWVAQTFREQGVTVPIFVSGYGISPEVHHPPAQPKDPATGFKVGCWGDSFGSRKNVSGAIQAFIHANLPDDATMEVKVNSPRLVTPKQITVAGEPDARITIVNQSWPIGEMTNWLRSLDVMIYLSGGEGYGLMPLEAMACGVPVISMIHTGMADYMTPDNVLEVPVAGMTEAPSYDYRFGEKSYMRTPVEEAVVYQLRRAYFDRAAVRKVGQRAAEDAARLTWDRAGQQAVEQLEKVRRRVEPLFEIHKPLCGNREGNWTCDKEAGHDGDHKDSRARMTWSQTPINVFAQKARP